MPSQRRLRVFFMLVLALVVSMLFFTSHLRYSQQADTDALRDFYHRTVNAMDKSRSGGQTVIDPKGHPVDHDADGDIDEDDRKLAQEMADRLKAAEQRAKDNANAKAPNKPDQPSKVIGVGSSAGGQGKKAVGDASSEMEEESPEEHEVEEELNIILKKSPVIIFSKSYCPHSKRAKDILLEKYSIDPAPFVVELDLHPLGAKLQAKLGQMTGRKTVPNVMINGKSIGGGDDVAALHSDKALADKIKSLGGKRVEVTERFSQDAPDQKKIG